MGIDLYQKATAIDRANKVYMYLGPRLFWSFWSENRCSKWFESRRSFSLSAASEIICEDWEKRLLMSSVSSVMVLWAGDLETALQTELGGMSRRPSDTIKSRAMYQGCVWNLLCRSLQMLFCPQFPVFLAILQWCGHNPQMHSALHILSVLVKTGLGCSIVSVRCIYPSWCLYVTEQSGRSVLLTWCLTWC